MLNSTFGQDFSSLCSMHVFSADVARIRPRVHGDAVGSGLQAQGGGAQDAGNAQVAGVAHQRHLVEVDGKGGVLGHSDCRSIIIWRVRSVFTPQW
jgi:hypothetical protein